MNPGDLRFWNDYEPPGSEVFVLLEWVLLDSAGNAKEPGWRILEGDIVKSVYENIVQHYSRPAEEFSK